MRLKTNFSYFISTIIITLKYSMYVVRRVDPKTIMGVIGMNCYWEGMREVNTEEKVEGGMKVRRERRKKK